MERISIFNYEAFYLDYLEGVLGQEDERMLMEFLEEHPECKLDDDELPVFENESNEVFASKSLLKQVDEKEAITLQNVEHFLIAESEAIIQDHKKKELQEFIAEHPELNSERQAYASVYFEADLSEQYNHKSELKKSRRIVLWPYIASGVAAAIVILIFLNGSRQFEGTTDRVGQDQRVTAEQGKDPKVKDVVIQKSETPIEQEQSLQVAEENMPVHKVIQSSPQDDKLEEALEIRGTQRSMITIANKKLQPITKVYPKQPEVNPNHGPALVKNDQMENPIEPITDFISKKTNRDVDFGRKPAKGTGKKGFFFKVGKFEVSRNKH